MQQSPVDHAHEVAVLDGHNELLEQASGLGLWQCSAPGGICIQVSALGILEHDGQVGRGEEEMAESDYMRMREADVGV